MKNRLYLYLGLFLAGSSLLATERRITSYTSEETVRAHIIQQFRDLDFTLEHLGQAINNNSAKVPDKKQAAAYILKVRTTLQTFVHSESSYDLLSLLGLNRAVTDAIAASIESHLSTMKELPLDTLKSDIEQADPNSIEIELSNRDIRIDLLNNYIGVLGLSPLNLVSRSLSDFDKDRGVSKFFLRTLPYLGLMTYWWLTIEELPVVQKIDNEPKPVPVMGILQVRGNQEEPFQMNVAVVNPDQLLGGNKPTAPKGKTRLASYSEKLGSLSNLFSVEVKPIIPFAAATVLAPYITEDIKDVYNFMGAYWNRATAYCKGMPYDDGSGYKKSSAKFTDVLGAHRAKAELMRIVDYFKDKKAIDRTGASVDRSFLLVGPLDTSKSLAAAIAGEVTAVLKEQNHAFDCSILEIHASSLSDKSLKNVLKDAEKRAPCIVVLDEIDCIYESKKIDKKVWGDLVSTMNGLARSKKDVFVVTTATKNKFASQVSMNRYGIYCKVENPTNNDRDTFFSRELEKRAISATTFDFEKLIQRTEGCTFAQLTSILKRALAKSHNLREPLTQDIFEKSIADVIENYQDTL
ncbi:ATP-binding protein [Candidatus Dependentiae bacterium]|nr:ATP-binding protein [Candidatus Dependentiae bacterium]